MEDFDKYEKDDIILYRGDCNSLIGSEINKFDCLITDPPYYTPAKISSTRKSFRRSLTDYGIFTSWFQQIATKIEGSISPEGHLYVFCDGKTYPLFYPMFYPFTKNLRALIWDKKTSINGYSWRHQHEMVMWGEMPEAMPIKTGDGDIFTIRAVPVNDRKHPAQKPVELIKRFILKSTKEGDVVFDPFYGVGTTALACMETGRKFVGCELSVDYFETAKKFLEVDRCGIL